MVLLSFLLSFFSPEVFSLRSMYVSMLALALTVLLCACVSNVPVWETVDDAQVCQGERRLPSTIVFAVPEGAAVQTFSASGAAQSCSAQDGSYEITATVLTEDDPESAIRALTGFDADRLQIVRTTRFSLPEYQFAWSAATGEGERLYRAAMLCDERYCYALCFSVPAGSGTSYDSIQESVFASFGLYYDEML